MQGNTANMLVHEIVNHVHPANSQTLLVEALIVPIVWLENIQALLLRQLVPLVPQVNIKALVDGAAVILVILDKHQMLSAAPL